MLDRRDGLAATVNPFRCHGGRPTIGDDGDGGDDGDEAASPLVRSW